MPSSSTGLEESLLALQEGGTGQGISHDKQVRVVRLINAFADVRNWSQAAAPEAGVQVDRIETVPPHRQSRRK